MIKYKYLSCNKEYSNRLNEVLTKKFKNTFKFSHNDINKFILFLRKGIHSYEYMNDWEKFNETELPGREEFYKSKRYYRCRLHACEKSLQRLWNKKFRWTSLLAS